MDSRVAGSAGVPFLSDEFDAAILKAIVASVDNKAVKIENLHNSCECAVLLARKIIESCAPIEGETIKDPALVAIMAMIPRLSPATRLELGRELVGDVRRMATVGTLPDAVMSLISDGVGHVSAITTILMRVDSQLTSKQIRNALSYLTRRNEVQRIGPGQYRVAKSGDPHQGC